MDASRRRVLGGGLAVSLAAFVPRLRFSAAPVAVSWLWAGGVTTSTASAVVKVDAGTPSVRVKVSTASDLSVSPVFSDAVVADANGYAKVSVSGLSAGTLYYYRGELDGTLNGSTGLFRTLPSSSNPGFEFAFGSCSLTASNHLVWDGIASRDPLFFVHLGDFHYEDISTNNQTLFRSAYESCMSNSRRAGLHRSVSNVYVWDDHDFGGNDSDGTSAARPAAAAVYRQVVPHHTLPAGAGDNPIYQTWNVGRVKFILTDLRHGRSPITDTDNSSKTMLGSTQKAWFKEQLTSAASDQNCAAVVWLSSAVWCADTTASIDHWGGYNTERVELANYIRDSRCPPILLLGGDTHSVCFDDGRRGDYATGGGGPVASFHASALDQGGLTVGGPWMSGSNEGGGRFGLVQVVDDGTNLSMFVRGVLVDAGTGSQSRMSSMVFRAAPTQRLTRRRALTA